MGLFNRKDKMDVFEKTQINLEKTQRNIETLNQLALANLKNTNMVVIESEKTEEDIEPMQAAYALNLCTVSVTQIIDYMDLNIMEQEYDMILNNLNLQNMPDDEALLDILKQILNTITFFKIDQKEREFIERDYQQRMKNAVWSAVPNVGAIVATGLSKGPAMMAMSLAASVGTAYMSYRKQKVENQNAYEREMWQLEKSAIEQFDGLKRELFDTAWRLAKHYCFDDKYRLTERQIHQYNMILMDSDSDRKYARLEAISDKFEAYPTFWYQFGHTANLVAIEVHKKLREKTAQLSKLETKWAENTGSDDLQVLEEITMLKQEISDLAITEEQYLKKAKAHFEYYQNVNRFSLLREDKIASMCYLEYVELMIQIGEVDKKILLSKLEDAAKYAGESLEVLQLCVFAYMKLGETSLAEKYLKILVNENHNCVMNAQILSSLYVHQYFSNQDRANARWNYNVLKKRVESSFLFPMPKEPNADREELERQFIYAQKFSLIRRYKAVLNELTNKYAICFNRCIPRVPSIQYNKHSYDDTYERRKSMLEQLNRFIDRDKEEIFRDLLMQEDIFESFTDVLQEYFYKLYELLKDEKNSLENDLNYEWLKEDILSPISRNRKDIEEFRLSIQNPSVSQKDIVYSLFNKYTFMFFVKDMLSSYADMLTDRIEDLKNMEDISMLEATLLKFCMENELTLPTNTFSVESNDSSFESNFLFEELDGGEEYENLQERNKLRKEISEIIVNYCKENRIIKRENKSRLYVRGINDNDIVEYLGKIKGYNAYKLHKADVFAVIEEKGFSKLFNNTDLWLTTNGIAIVKGDKFPSTYISYKEVKFSEDEIVCGRIKYSNSEDVDISALRDMIVEISKISGTLEEKHELKDNDFSNQCFDVDDGENAPLLYLKVNDNVQ